MFYVVCFIKENLDDSLTQEVKWREESFNLSNKGSNGSESDYFKLSPLKVKAIKERGKQ